MAGLAAALISVSCRAHSPFGNLERGVAGCLPTGQQASAAPDTNEQRRFAGEYEGTEVTTVRGYQEPVRSGRLVRALNDTTSRFDVATIRGPVRRGDGLLAGTLVSPPYTRATVATAGPSLVVGCDQCFDASPSIYAIETVESRGLRGRWSDGQTGITRAIDKKGRILPAPSGYACARRIPS
jgi:hypothetical protein